MTALIPYQPFRDPFAAMPRTLSPMRRSRFFGAWPTQMLRLADDLTRWPVWSTHFNGLFGDNLAVDMRETDHEVIITAEVPGVTPDQVTIEAQDGWLSIRVQQSGENHQNHMGWLMHERYFGAWQRTLRLPTTVNTDNADATLENGVLTVTLPKTTNHTPLLKRIKVNFPKLKLPKLGRKEPKIKVISGKAS